MSQPLANGVIITDCIDHNARVRQEIRFRGLFGIHPSFLGLKSAMPTVEAAGNLVDQLGAVANLPDSHNKGMTIILVNVAPRGSDVKQKWDNGTPFCYFRTGNTLVVSTYEGHCLALARDMGLVDSVELFDIPTVTAAAVQWGELTPGEADRINHTQFRSLEFLPLVALWLYQGRNVPSTTQSLADLPHVGNAIWFIDNFGNAKTTLLPEDIGFEQGKKVSLAIGLEVACYNRLADVPQGETALTIGSSGYKAHRFVELVVQRQSAARVHNLKVGDPVLAD